MTPSGPYKMRTIARLTNFAPALLRAWERRHHLLDPMRSPGGHRLYTEQDLQVLLRVRELIQSGRSIGEIAGLGRDALLRQRAERLEQQPAEPPVPEPLGPDALEALNQQRDRIVDDALRMDALAINRTLDQSFARVSPDSVIFEVILPATRKIGDLWAAGQCSVASEHIASGVFVHRMFKLIEAAEPLRSELRPLVVACFPDEYHQLGALIVAYQLCRHGFRAQFLGAALPFEDLESACNVLRPCAALLSATRPEVFGVHKRALLDVARRGRDKLQFYVGGQGAPADDAQLRQLGVRTVPGVGDPRESISRLAEQIRKSAAEAHA